MPSIAVQAAVAIISAATADGRLTVDSNAHLYPGTNAWVIDDAATVHARVKILACIGTDTVLVRRWPTKPQKDASEVAHDQENYGPPSYGVSDMTDFNGGGRISMEAQSAPVDPAHFKRVVP